MKLLALFLLTVASWGQCIEIRYSQQGAEIVKAIVGTLPKTVSLYRADVVNNCATEARMFPARVGFEAAGTAPMQDPEAALFAAQHYKDTRWWVVSLKVLGELGKYGGPAALGLLTAGVPVPVIVTGIAGSIGGSAAVLDGYRKDASALTVPATWLRDDMPEIILPPGRDVPYLLVLGGTPPATFKAVVGESQKVSDMKLDSKPISNPCAGVIPPGGWYSCENGEWKPYHATSSGTFNISGAISTHPQIDDDEAEHFALVTRLIREATAARGAVE